MTDAVIESHLLGEETIGVYPLLPDETCWFLAADFDNRTWEYDVLAFLETCQDFNVPAALERSRSGKGGHIWIFFDCALSAIAARKLECFPLTRTMERRHQLGLDSYDRFFPNQEYDAQGRVRQAAAAPASVPEDESRVILATGSYIGEGFDDARLDTLFLAMSISWKGTLQQCVDRLHRLHDNKRFVQVYDYVYHYVPMLARMYERRLKGYNLIGYAIEPETPLPDSPALSSSKVGSA